MTVQVGEDLGQRARVSHARMRFQALLRGRAARTQADYFDRLVDAELEFVRRLPVHVRHRPAEALAVLVMLAQDYRHYAQGWISRRELRRRCDRALAELDRLRLVMGEAVR